MKNKLENIKNKLIELQNINDNKEILETIDIYIEICENAIQDNNEDENIISTLESAITVLCEK